MPGPSDPGFDWPGLMRAGLGALRLPPAVFWSMTPVELRRALEGAGLLAPRDAILGRRRLDELMAAHPDMTERMTDGRDRF